ncbi:MAG: Crp/Fnr family transcriptional regulator [Marinilabiliaceae bacterium]|nr:Crp/Fnr family transcriptional regulator [Marinilabiliaceae bacterium]
MNNKKTILYNNNINLSDFELFNSLTQMQIEYLNQNIICNQYHKGTVIIHEGSRTSSIYVVIKGISKTYSTGFDGKEQILRFEKPGDIIGFNSLLNEEISNTSTKVIYESIVYQIPGEQFINIIKANPDFSLSLIRKACKELNTTNKYLTDVAQKKVKERLAEILLFMHNTFGVDSENFINISLTREEMANMVGTATESAIRLLSEFKHEGLIYIEGRKIKLLNKKQLARIGNIYR